MTQAVKVKNRDREPNLNTTIFGLNFSEGTGFYPVSFQFFVKNALFKCRSSMKVEDVNIFLEDLLEKELVEVL